jgi:hypothetical protein
MRRTEVALLAALLLPWTGATAGCGERIEVEAASGRTAYALQRAEVAQEPPMAVLLLVGGGGLLELDPAGCPRRLQGNFLVRALRHFQAAGLSTALVDASTGYGGDDGLAGYRSSPDHASDLGRVIADLRARMGAPVWVVGTSRGTISAANAAARLRDDQAPDGVVLTSLISDGGESRRKPWTSQTVLNLPLEQIRMPGLLVGHAADACARSPAGGMQAVARRWSAVRTQTVVVEGGPGRADPGVDACEGRSPHGYVGQEAEVVAGIVRFMRGAAY